MKQLSPVTRTIASLVLVGVGVGGFVLMGTPEVSKKPPTKKTPPIVQTVVAADHKDGIQFEVDGVVVPYRQIEIAAQVSGRVDFKADQCRIGRAVKQGDLLVRIEQKDYELEVKQLSEELAQADAMIKELEAEIVTAENQIASAEKQLEIDIRQLKRTSDLLARKAASEAELDSARRAELNSRNALQTLQDQKNLLNRRRVRLESEKVLQQANLDKADLALERTEIKSPLDGVVVRENVEQDGYIQMGNTAISLQDTSQLDVACKLHMRQMHWLWQSKTDDAETDADLTAAYDFPDTPATVIYQLGGNSWHWKGVVNRYDGAGIDDQTRMVPCRVYVKDPLSVTTSQPDTAELAMKPPTLMTGMFVKVRIDVRPPIPLVRLPPESIQPGNTVWTVRDGKLKRKDVQIATSNPNTIIVHQQSDGLQAGDIVVVSPLATPIEGMPVNVINDARTAQLETQP